MKVALRFEGEVTEDGQLHLDLPSAFPKGRVLVTLEILQPEDFDVPEAELRGTGLTAAEIALAPEIGSWSDDRAVPTGADYVEDVRRGAARYSW